MSRIPPIVLQKQDRPLAKTLNQYPHKKSDAHGGRGGIPALTLRWSNIARGRRRGVVSSDKNLDTEGR